MISAGIRLTLNAHKLILNQIRGKIAILLYHRVASHIPDPQLLCVSTSNFDQQIKYLKANFDILSMPQLADCLNDYRLPHKAVVITFDDGYADNYFNAFPILQHYAVPATIYVSSGYVSTDKEMLSDELEYLILQAKNLPDKIILDINGISHTFEFDNISTHHIPWDITCQNSSSKRYRSYYDLHKIIKPLDSNYRERVLNSLAERIGCPRPKRFDRRIMNKNEIRILDKNKLITIGAHALSHVMLAQQNYKEQYNEIAVDKNNLEELLGHTVHHFAYPYGGNMSVSQDTTDFVQKLGYLTACDSTSGLVYKKSNKLLLPRFIIRNWDVDIFKNHIKSFFRY